MRTPSEHEPIDPRPSPRAMLFYIKNREEQCETCKKGVSGFFTKHVLCEDAPDNCPLFTKSAVAYQKENTTEVVILNENSQ